MRSHERWREVPAVLLGLLSFGLGLGWMQTRRLLDEIGERSLSAADSGGGGGEPALDLVRHAAFIAFASGAVGMGALAVSLRARFRCNCCHGIRGFLAMRRSVLPCGTHSANPSQTRAHPAACACPSG